MNNAIDVPTNIGEAPIENHNPWFAAYFVVFTIFTSFFVTNLFVGASPGTQNQDTSLGVLYELMS